MRFWFPSSHYALLSLFYFIGLELLFILHQWPVILFFIILGVLIIGIFLIRTEEGSHFHPTQSILPALAAFGFTALAVYLPQTFFLHFYFLICAILFFFIIKYGARRAWPTWNTTISLIVLFVCVAPVIGWRFYLYTPVGSIIAIIFPIIGLMAFQSLLRYVKTASEAGLIALAIAFVLTETVWILQFLPLHFIVQSGFVISLYYTLIQIVTAVFEHRLTRALLIESLAIGTIGIMILLGTARWS